MVGSHSSKLSTPRAHWHPSLVIKSLYQRRLTSCVSVCKTSIEPLGRRLSIYCGHGYTPVFYWPDLLQWKQQPAVSISRSVGRGVCVSGVTLLHTTPASWCVACSLISCCFLPVGCRTKASHTLIYHSYRVCGPEKWDTGWWPRFIQRLKVNSGEQRDN